MTASKRGLRFLGHRVHPALSDFPLVLLVLAPFADTLGWVCGENTGWFVGFGCSIGGIVSALPAAVAGFVDYRTIEPDSKPSRTAFLHMSVMLSAVCCSVLGLTFRGGTIPDGSARVVVVAFEWAASILVAAGGWLGGHLVFHHGIGVDSK
jgi:uncharacterized membrane protein